MRRPKANEVLIKTKACGVCHSDLHVIKVELPLTSPCVVGHEITDEVVEHGQLSDGKIVEEKICYLSGLPVGSQVVGAFIMPCGICSFCSKDQDDLCEDFFAYNRAKGTLYDGETRLFLCSSDVQDEKLQKAKFLGATHCVNASKEDAVKTIKDITGGFGVDIAVEALGRPKTFLQCVQSVGDGDTALMVGLAQSGSNGQVDINHLVRRQIKVIGSYGARARQDLPKLIKLAESGIFNLTAAVSRICKFEDAPQAYNIAGRFVVEII
ncbi:unnamed protein product [Withania somnifera]